MMCTNYYYFVFQSNSLKKKNPYFVLAQATFWLKNLHQCHRALRTKKYPHLSRKCEGNATNVMFELKSLNLDEQERQAFNAKHLSLLWTFFDKCRQTSLGPC